MWNNALMIVFNNVTYILHVREGDICVTTQRGLLEEGEETIQIIFLVGYQ